MLDFINKTIGKFFGTKSERDVKEATPQLEKTLEEYAKLEHVSNDELRDKTGIFKEKIQARLLDSDNEIAALNQQIEDDPDMDLEAKQDLYTNIDTIKKSQKAMIEEVLKEILPEAFAVVKETARRFKEHSEIEVTATQMDRDLAVVRQHIVINDDKAVYKNSWMAAGNMIKWDMLHYDVQLIGGIVLHDGKIAEMATGEGKTLVGTLPIYLNALAGRGVHIVTVNDYLARRDSEWNGTIFEFLGLTVDCIDKHEPNSEARKKAYNSDITYGTNNEFGFDYLRDNMVRNPEDMVQRDPFYAIVDEVDSVLIDDARTPLIISGPTPTGENHEFFALKPKVEILMKAQRDFVNSALVEAKKKISSGDETAAGLALLRAYRGLPKNKALVKFLGEQGMRVLLQKTENFYMADQSKEMHKVDEELYFVIDEKNNTIELTEKGTDLITSSSEDSRFFIMPDVGSEIAEIEKSSLPPNEKIAKKDVMLRDFAIKSERIHTINQLLKAYTLFDKDVEYIIVDGKVKIVDEQTGRVLDGRRYSDGLHQAIEAKEDVKIEAVTQTFATITLQNYFRMYHKLAGMTGTAETEAGELWQIYKLDVVVIPTHRKMIRKDYDDLVYKTRREKYNAVIEEIVTLVEAKRPVLVGTTSVEISELLSRMLTQRKIKHNVLNAKLHQREADIVAEAGQAGTVTIATNMAGRGTDIKLGPGVKDAGGLAIIGTERHESRRVDRQLRGRSGRQGDPGSSQFYVSLEDELMRLFGSARIGKMMDTLGIKEGEVIQHPMITQSIERAQKKVEENNFGIRKRLLEYDDVMNSQREVIYSKRKHALFGERLALDIVNSCYDVCESIITNFQEQRDYAGFQLEIIKEFAMECPIPEEIFLKENPNTLTPMLFQKAQEHYKQKSKMIAEKVFPFISDAFHNGEGRFENALVPFTDGVSHIQVIAPIKKSYQSKGKEVITTFEKSVSLSLIDDNWKEHLRELDELKTSVQNAVYEQKDPLLIYKFESFKLFQELIERVNKDTTSFLFKGNLEGDRPDEIREVKKPQKTDMSKLKLGRDETDPDKPIEKKGNKTQAAPPPAAPREKVQPVRAEQKIGRNDPCPCGSGKKYKNCHGKEAS
jgi:preprotein translocase subunit SecA